MTPKTLVLKGDEKGGPFSRQLRYVRPLPDAPCRVCERKKPCRAFLVCKNGSGYYCCDDCFASLGLLW